LTGVTSVSGPSDISFIVKDLATYNFIAFAHDHPADISTGIFAGNSNNRICNYFKYLFEHHDSFSKWITRPSEIGWAEPTTLAIEYMKKLIQIYSREYKTYCAPEWVYPIYWKKSKDYYWKPGKIDDKIWYMPMICLHNETYSAEHKSMSEKEVLEANYRISNIFKRVLEED